jgi:aspartyl/asparaginyl beta-hydroxylase (cupin superfamily)
VFLVLGMVLLIVFFIPCVNGLIVSGLSADRRTAFPDLDKEFPEHHVLEQAWKEIAKEALQVYKDKQTEVASKASKLAFGRLTRGQEENWKVFMLTFYGKDYEDNQQLCPTTTALIKSIPSIHYAMFSIMEPHTKIPTHTGRFRGCLRYHLGLSVPENTSKCFINVDDQQYSWKEGEGVLFDDTFRHFVVNETNEPRLILFCDVQRGLSGLPDKLNEWIINSKLPHFFHVLNSKNEKAVVLR